MSKISVLLTVMLWVATSFGETATPVMVSKTESRVASPHRFFDKQNSRLFAINALAQASALLAIQSQGAHMESRGRTLDGFEKHFESYGYGWGSAYRFGGGVGLNMLVAAMFHESGHHKLERWVPLVAIGHAGMSTGYALSGSRQSNHGGW
jgi:hypothetical protein